MKKIVLLIAVVALISCKKEVSVNYAVVSGKISNKTEKNISINSFDRKFKKSIAVMDDGSFIDTLNIETDTFILDNGKHAAYIYLKKGSNIKIDYDANDFENTLTFSGKDSEVSSYLLANGVKERELIGKSTVFYALEEDDYKAKINEIKTALEEIIMGSDGIPDAYKAKELRNINYGYLNKLSKYQMYHAHYAKKPDFKTSDGFLGELEGFDYHNEEDYLFSSPYKQLVNAHYKSQASITALRDSIPADLAYLKSLEVVENEIIKNDLLYKDAVYGITRTDQLEDYYNAFMAASTDENNRKEITKSYTTLKTVTNGQSSPKFEGYENFAGGTTSLEDLKGKFVYVDVWATWCGPCKREIPFLKEVEKKYHGKNIEFVSISVDKAADHDKWKAMVKEKELGGIQLFANNSWESDFIQSYLIKGIPRFILIDPNGNIVSSKAPRPSNEKLIEMFNDNNI